MSNEYHLYGCKGWGSVLPECFLALCSAPMAFEDVDGFDKPGAPRERLLKVNPLAQVPALVLLDGEVMTESAAMALLLAERYPQAPLAPPPDSPERPAFLRWLVWIVANIYPTFTVGDYPERLADTEAPLLRARIEARREVLWKQFEATLDFGRDTVLSTWSALDVYVTVMTRWRPGRAWFARHCPRMNAIAVRGDAHPVLQPVLQRNFPS